MLAFGWGEIFLVLIVLIIVVGPKDLPKLIKQLTSFSKSIKKLSREFKSSLNDIADHEDLKNVKSSISDVNKIKNDLNLKEDFKNEIKFIKETDDLVKKKIKDIKDIKDVNKK